MKNKKILQKIKSSAAKDSKNRADLRYKRAIAFLVKKGFLKKNESFLNYYQARNRVADFIWAGQNVEPRILEVLPAAAARLPRAFIFLNSQDETVLLNVINQLKMKFENGDDFMNMPYNKIKIWMNINLLDGRTKKSNEKRVMKTFRLKQLTIEKIRKLKLMHGLSEAEIIDKLINAA